jgi:hypothetical protein
VWCCKIAGVDLYRVWHLYIVHVCCCRLYHFNSVSEHDAFARGCVRGCCDRRDSSGLPPCDPSQCHSGHLRQSAPGCRQLHPLPGQPPCALLLTVAAALAAPSCLLLRPHLLRPLAYCCGRTCCALLLTVAAALAAPSCLLLRPHLLRPLAYCCGRTCCAYLYEKAA